MRELLTFLSDHKTKILGGILAVKETFASAVAGGLFDGLLPIPTLRWLNIVGMLLAAAITGVGFVNTTKERVAGAMETAIKATPQLLCVMMFGFLMAVSLAGCVTEQPQGFRDRAVIAESSVNAVVSATTTSLEAGAITADDAVYVRDLAKRAREILGLAERAHEAGDISTAEGRLALAEGVLRELQQRVKPKRRGGS